MEKWIILISSILLLAFLCWKETRRKNKARLVLRIAASVGAVAALYFIAMPITFQRNLDPSKENTAVLLTSGYESDSLSSLKNIPVYSADISITSKNNKVKPIPDLEYFSRSQADINKIHILGSGLDQHELQAFKNHQLIFHPTEVSGFTSVDWNSTIRSGEKLRVQGSFNSGSNKSVKILLRGLSTTLDSLELGAKQTTFDLSTFPKLLDKAVYSLIALSGKDTLASEKIPLIIEKKTPLKILLLSSSPGFESKFLKTWLFEENYALAVRTTISKNKYSTEFLNTERMNLNRVGPGILESFDIVIGDVSALSDLSYAESSAIQNQVGKGMGLLILADGSGGAGFYRQAFNIRQNRAIDSKTLTLNWNGQTAKKTSLPSGPAMEIVSRPGEQALVRDNKNNLLVSSKLYGAGRILASTVPDTYTWMLSNNSADYSSFWSHILEKAARKTETTENWAVLDQFPVINAPARLSMESSATEVPAAAAAGIPLHFAQDVSQPFRWTANYWPSESGWQSIRSGDKDFWWYVYDQTDWSSARAGQKVERTARFVSENGRSVKQAADAVRTYTYRVPALWLYVLFLVCCSFLWAERKFA